MFDLPDKQQQTIDIISNYLISLGGGNFCGKISDFNVWSRILSTQEISTYSLGCDQNFVKLSNPENVIWTAVNITYQGSNTKTEVLSTKEFCQTGDKSRAIIIGPESNNYENSIIFCNQLNGELFYPASEENLEWFMSSYDQFVAKRCSNIFWVPFVKSKQNKTNFVHDTKLLPQTEISNEPWKRAKSTETGTKVNCMLFNITSKEYVTSQCDIQSCSFCQVEEKRQKFTINSICDELTQIDHQYFLVQEKNDSNFYFRGVSGLTQMVQDNLNCYDWTCWKLELLNYVKESKRFIAVLTADFLITNYPFGTITWNTTLDCTTTYKTWNPMKFKFNNVRLSV